MKVLRVLPIFVVLLTGCGDDDTSTMDAATVDAATVDADTADAATTPTLAQFCEGFRARETRCDSTSADCEDLYCDYDSNVHTLEYLNAYLACNDRACDESCTPSIAANPGFADECNARHDACAASFRDDYCDAVGLTDAALASARTCLADSCDTIHDCLADVLFPGCL